jgi:hypothetical protein
VLVCFTAKDAKDAKAGFARMQIGESSDMPYLRFAPPSRP